MRKSVKKKLIQSAVNIARANNTPEKHPRYAYYVHFTFIVQDGTIIAYGMNRAGRSIYAQLGYPKRALVHSENDAYKKAKGLLNHKKPFSAINIRLNRMNEFRAAAPCPCCRSFLKIMGCNKVIFTTNTGFGKEIF